MTAAQSNVAPSRGIRRLPAILVAGFMLVSIQGCLFPFLVGAGAGAGGLAWYRGYLKIDYAADVPKTARAAEVALSDLGFQIESSRFDRFGARIKGTRATGQKFLIVMDRAGPSKTTVKIRVGIPGDREMAEEVEAAIRKRLSS